MPQSKSWFVRPGPRMPYEAASPVDPANPTSNPPTLAELNALVNQLHDYGLAAVHVIRRYGDRAPYAEARRVFGPRLDYDLRAVSVAKALTVDTPEHEPLLRHACDLYVGNCLELADLWYSLR